MASYVDAVGDVTAVDTSCMEELPPMTFYPADSLVEKYLEDQNTRLVCRQRLDSLPMWQQQLLGAHELESREAMAWLHR